MKRFFTALCATLLCSSVCLITAQAKPRGPIHAPLERLLQNTDAYLKAHPNDPQAYFTRGRLRYFAFALNGSDIPLLSGETEGLPYLYEIFGLKPQTFQTARNGMTEEERKKLVPPAVADLEKAIKLRDANSKEKLYEYRPGLYELTLACLYDDAKESASKDWHEKAIRYYRAAYELSAPKELSITRRPTFGVSTLVSHEAGTSYLRLVNERGIHPSEKTFVASVETGVKKLKDLPMGAISPIVFSLQANTSLNDLLHLPKRPIAFDLAGTGKTQRYSQWPAPTTAILVWNPNSDGRITSGRQLFGTSTWWMLYSDGYRAMDALDDDRNGWLEGKELSGLALWFDRNGNGISNKGEVVPLSQTPIDGIAVHATIDSSGVLANQEGLRLRNGTLLPTYDWVVTPL